MGLNIKIVEQKFFNQFYNDDDFSALNSQFTENLAASVMEKIKVSTIIDVGWFTSASDTNKIIASTANGIQVFRRESGSYFDDGFVKGDIVGLSSNGFFEIYDLEEDKMYFNVATGVVDNAYSSFTIVGATTQTALKYNFGLIGNDENYSIASKVSGNDCGYYLAGITTSFQEMNSLGNYKDWKTGTARVKSLGIVSNPFYAQRFEIEHEFIVVPYYLNGQLTNLENNIIPSLLAGENSLKYVFETKFREVISNPNNEKKIRFENNLGSVGWFNENFNGFNTNYEVTSVLYSEANTFQNLDGISVGGKTKVYIIVNNNEIGGTYPNRLGVYVSYLPTEEEYTDTNLTDFKDNFIYDSVVSNVNNAAKDGSSFITDLQITQAGSSQSLIIFDIEYDSLQKAFLAQKKSINEANFVIGVLVGDVGADAGNSDRVMLLADVNAYDDAADIPDLIVNPEFNLFPYQYEVGTDTGFTSLEQWNEDGFTVDGSFQLDLNKDAFINSLEFRLIAIKANNNQFFELDKYVLNVANPIVQNGIPKYNIETTRGYNLEDGSQFNEISFKNDSQISNIQKYNFRFSQKISWQDWIANNLVDTVFFNSTKPNNNLNYKASNYSSKSGYFIKLSMFANVSGTSDLGVSGTTDYHILSPEIKVYDYDLDGNESPEWTAQIETFNLSTMTNTFGSVLSGQDTLFRITWTNSGGAVSSLDGISIIQRIEEAEQNGYNIDELGTLYSYPNNNRLIPKGGFTNLDYFIDNGNIVSECLIDGSKIIEGVSYSLSGKLEAVSNVDPNAKLTSPNSEPKDTSATVETKIIAQ